MPYSAQAALSVDPHFYNRVAACAAQEVLGSTTPDVIGPEWATANVWRIAATPGFAEAYQYALDMNVVDPGKDVGVITDTQIQAAVQPLLPRVPIIEEEIPE